MQPSYAAKYVSLWQRHWWWQARHEMVLREVTQLQLTLPHLFDIGCAGGVAFDDFERIGKIHGIEPDQRLIDALPQWQDRVELAAFDEHYQLTQEADIVLMLDVLEHIDDDRGTLEHLHRIVPEGAFLVMTVPALTSLWSVHDEINLHFRRYSRRQLEARLGEAGFEVLKCHYCFGWSLPLFYLRRWLAPRDPQCYDVQVPWAFFNCVFRTLSQIETRVCRLWRGGPPLGSSLLAVAYKPVREGDLSSTVAA